MKVTLFSVLLLLLVGSAHAMDLIVKNMHYVMGEIPKHVYNAQVLVNRMKDLFWR